MSDVDKEVRARREDEARLAEAGKEGDRIAKANADFFLRMFQESVKNGPAERNPEYDNNPLWDLMTKEEREAMEANWLRTRRKIANIFHRQRYAGLYAYRARINAERLSRSYLHDGRGKFNASRPPIREVKRAEYNGHNTADLSWFFESTLAELPASATTEVHRVSKRHFVSVPNRLKPRQWFRPASMRPSTSAQPDAIPSIRFLADIARREKTPPLSHRARMQARAHVAAMIERQRHAFEATLGFTAAAARRKDTLRKIEWAKAWTQRPRPPKRLPGIIVWAASPEYRLIKTRGTSAPQRVPTRTRNKVKLTPGRPKLARRNIGRPR